jgi:hypothetical protein
LPEHMTQVIPACFRPEMDIHASSEIKVRTISRAWISHASIFLNAALHPQHCHPARPGRTIGRRRSLHTRTPKRMQCCRRRPGRSGGGPARTHGRWQPPLSRQLAAAALPASTGRNRHPASGQT